MTSLLYSVANGSLPDYVDDDAISKNTQLAIDLQTRLQDFWLITNPDGKWGRKSSFALRTYKQFKGIKESGLGIETAKSLINSNPQDLITGFKLNGDWASRTIMWMTLNNYHISTREDEINIIYFRGLDKYGKWNGNRPFVFNDRRVVMSIKDGVPTFLGNWLATCDPGEYYWENPMNPNGCADIKFGQYQAWSVGYHKNQHALIQTGNITVLRGGDRIPDAGDDFYVDQHTTSGDYGVDDEIGRWSAGCMVGASDDEHYNEFMPLVQSDHREKADPGNYKHWTTIINGDDFLAAFPCS